MISASWPRSRKYSPIVPPEEADTYCIAADGVVHRPVLLERAHHVLDRARLLADRDVDAGHVLALLVDDRVDRDRGLAGLAVADDQLALAAPDRHHRVKALRSEERRVGKECR